jgi:acetyl-CoA acetyltransferase
MKRHHARRGIAALCIGGGEATAVALEIVQSRRAA